MISVIGNSEDQTGRSIANWHMNKTNKPVFGPYAAIGFLDTQGEIKGSILLVNYNGANIEAHIYVPGCITRANLKYLFNYVFNNLKCTRLTAIPERKNKKLISLLGRIGFVYEYNLVNYYGPLQENYGVLFRMEPKHAKKWISINA